MAVEGLQEWAQCQRMVKECAAYTDGQFKIIHAFNISMLALRYRTPLGDRVIWPNQYAWLLRRRLVDWQDHAAWGLSEENVRDKSKADGIAKLLALMQVSWFVAQCIMRAAHNLPISQIEAMTLGYIPVFFVCYCFWWNKPKDIRSPSIVELPDMTPEQKDIFELMAFSNKFDSEGMRDQVTYWNIWYLTPRLFEKEAEDMAIQEAQAARNTHMWATGKTQRTFADGSTKRHDIFYEICHEISHETSTTDTEHTASDLADLQNELRKEIVLSHWDPELYRSKIWPVMCLFSVLFPVLHLVAWNTVFPSAVEMWLWRGAVLLSILSMLVFMHFEKVVLRWDGLVTIVSIASPGLYIFSRVVMMVEVFVTLRAEDPTIYDTPNVSTYWVHFL